LHIIDGIALLGSGAGGRVIEARPGGAIYTASGEEHWHGAAPDRFMARLGLMEGDNADAPQTTRGEKVTDDDYQAPGRSTR
jgi:quercetin dioxygenase-like cupin family protein